MHFFRPISFAVSLANCAKNRHAFEKCIAKTREYTAWVMIVNEPGLSPEITESIYPDVIFHWGMHSRNLCIVTNMFNWKCFFNSKEHDIIILKCSALKDTCFLTGTYFNPRSTNEIYRKQTAEIHQRLYEFKSCRLVIGGDMNCKSLLWHARNDDAKGKIISNAFNHINLCPAFTPTDKNCRYNKFTGEKTWIDSICVDNKLFRQIRSYVFTHLRDSDHDLHTVIFDIQHSSKKIVSKQNLIKFFKKENWDFLAAPWMGQIDMENRVCKLEEILKTILDASTIQSYPTKKKINIPSCLVKRQRKLEKQFRKARKRKDPISDVNHIAQSIKDNQKLIKNFKKLIRAQRSKKIEKEKGIWFIIKRILGPNLFKRATSIDLFNKSNDIDHSQISSSFNQEDITYEPIFEIPETSIIPYNWTDMIKEVKKMLSRKKAVFKKHLSSYIFSILMDIAGDKIIRFTSLCLTKGFTPRNIKISRTCLIPKSCGTKFRPLSIMHPLYRIFDFMIYKYIKSKIKVNLELNHQHGFLPDVGVVDYFISLAKHLADIHVNVPTCVISIDLRDAFENISMDGIAYGLHKANLDSYDIMLVIQHISNRNSFLKIGSKIKWKLHGRGTPQGSFTSPMIFALTTIVLSPLNEHKFRILSFADDVCIIATGETEKSKKNRWLICEAKMLLLEDTLRLFGLNINQAKTKIMMLHNGRSVDPNQSIMIGNNKFKSNFSMRILGIPFNNSYKKSSKSRININDALQESLLELERIIGSNSTGFRGLKLRWAHIALTAFIRGRIEYYGLPLRMFMNQEKYNQSLLMSQATIGRIIKSALDLKRKTDHQLIYFLAFHRSLKDIIEEKLFKVLLAIRQRNAISWYPDIRNDHIENYTLSGVPLPIWDTSNSRASVSKLIQIPDITINKITKKEYTLIVINYRPKNLQRMYKYINLTKCGIDETSDALFLFLQNEMDISKGQAITIACDSQLSNFLEKPMYRTKLNCFLDNLEVKVMITPPIQRNINEMEIHEFTHTPLRIVINSQNFHKYINYKTHISLRDSTNNIMARGLHTYAFEQIDWKHLQRKDLYFICLLNGAWHYMNKSNDTCPYCQKIFHTIDFFLNPCEHIRPLIHTQFTQQNFLEHFSSIHRIRILASILLKCIAFFNNHSNN